MRVLILSFYYPPDLSAGSFRVSALVEEMLKLPNASIQVDVITTLPNRYHTHKTSALEYEDLPALSIRRVPLPQHQSGMFDQAKAFMVYAKMVWRETRGRNWDVVFATSSRLMTAALGAEIAKSINAPLYLDIRDLFTDTMTDVLSGSPLRRIIPSLRMIERRTFNSAKRISLVSEGFLPYVNSIAPKTDCQIFTNGIDDEFLSFNFECRSKDSLKYIPLIVYAGNIGEGQGLHKIVPIAATLLQGQARIRLIGDGGRRKQLEDSLARVSVSNVEILNPVSRDELLEHYKEADILFLHLNDHTAFRKVLPSKIFEYAASGKPILAGVSGFAATFIDDHIQNAEVFSPCDSHGMVSAFDRLSTNCNCADRSNFITTFSRKNIMKRMASDIINICN